MPLSKKQRLKANQKASKQPLPSLDYELAKGRQHMFRKRSRPMFQDINEPQEATEPGTIFRIVFGVYMEMLDFAGSLMTDRDQQLFAQRFPDLIGNLEAYRRTVADMFPAHARTGVVRYINDVAAGCYDMADAFLTVAPEKRAELLHLVKQFQQNKLLIQHQGAIPQILFTPEADQLTPLRLYGEYSSAGFRILEANNQTDERTELERVPILPAQAALPYEDAVNSVRVACIVRLNTVAHERDTPQVGVTYVDFPAEPEN